MIRSTVLLLCLATAACGNWAPPPGNYSGPSDYDNSMALLDLSARFAQMGQPTALPSGAYRVSPQVTTCRQIGGGLQCVGN